MIKMKMKDFFFDRQVVQNAVEAAERKVLAQVGGLIMKTARRSIKNPGKTKRTFTSRPGNPPKNHKGLLKSMIFFAWDPDSRRVIIGPQGFNNSNIPHVLEKGGTTIMNSVVVNGEFMSYKKFRTLYPYQRYRRDQINEARRTITLSPRPYMQPALEKHAGEAARRFKNTVTRGGRR